MPGFTSSAGYRTLQPRSCDSALPQSSLSAGLQARRIMTSLLRWHLRPKRPARCASRVGVTVHQPPASIVPARPAALPKTPAKAAKAREHPYQGALAGMDRPPNAAGLAPRAARTRSSLRAFTIGRARTGRPRTPRPAFPTRASHVFACMRPAARTRPRGRSRHPSPRTRCRAPGSPVCR